MRLLAVAVLLCTVAPQAATACSIVMEPKVEFDRSTFIFEGRVVGVVADSSAHAGGVPSMDQELDGAYPRAGAVLIEPVDVVNAPRRAAAYAVFPAGLGADCSPIYSTAEDLAGLYSVGDRVLVVAEGEGAPSGLGSSAVPLFAGCCGNVLTRVRDLGHWPFASTAPMSDSLGYWWERQAPSQALAEIDVRLGRAGTEAERWALYSEREAVQGRLQYEYERDLARLHRARSEEDRVRVLFKLRDYWFSGGSDCTYSDLVRRHLRQERSWTRLGAHILEFELRPLAPYTACEEVERIQAERREASKR